MSKPKDKSADKAKKAGDNASATNDPGSWSNTARETIESVVIAFVLAFLFRTFEAEAFVIPTGSMAPTLMGRHMDLTCPKCGYAYQVGPPSRFNASEDNTPLQDQASGICPICGFEFEANKDTPYYNGDRILVNKFAYDFAEPQRWDVIVFKFPEDAKTNYIKRLIGLPGEVIRVRDGDIMVSHDGGKTFAYVPREPAKLRAMLQIVYDNDYVYEPFIAKGWPQRWQGSDSGWTTGKLSSGAVDYKNFEFKPKTEGANPPSITWLRYHNFLPTHDEWKEFEAGNALPSRPAAKQIYDTIAYDRMDIGSNPVSDLALECEVNVAAPSGTLVLELLKEGRRFDCQLDLASGGVSLVIPGRAETDQPKAASGGISRAGSHQLLFANVDHQLTVLVDGKAVQFNKPVLWDDFDGAAAAFPPGQPADDVSPVGIGSAGATVTVSHLRVLRDIYYTYQDRPSGPAHPNFAILPRVPDHWPSANQWLCYPRSAIVKLQEAGADVRPRDQFFFVGDDRFLPMGDNSPSSQDGRFWLSEYHFDGLGRFRLTTRTEDDYNFVERRLLVGKALYIYWPHSFFFPIPNFPRMGFVR